VYVVPEYLPVAPSEPAIEETVEPLPSTGYLVLAPQPEHAQVFVDGYYAGVPEDFAAARGGAVLETGTHRIDISAPGYESLSFDVKKTAPAAAPTGPSTFYLIPGCYMGNIPPKDAHLPATCDLGSVVEFKY
jgi:hypothetical protein